MRRFANHRATRMTFPHTLLAPSLRWATFAVMLALTGCAATVKQDTRVQGDVSRVDGVSQVLALMSPDAARQQADNPQFHRDELANQLRRRLESKSLLSPAATHRVEVVVTDIRVRSAVAAIMLGVFAGDDHVTGRVRVLDARGQALRSFEINASYALGGWAGGQDSMRLGWLYDKFSELAATELEQVIRLPVVPAASASAPSASTVTVAGSMAAPAPTAAAAVATPAPVVNNTIRIDDVEAIPGLSERGRSAYLDWLTHKAPRAFVLADGGHWYGTWGTAPKEPMDPRDPSERALKRCRDAGKRNCALYAVDGNVVYTPASTSATR
jgi:Domain of unknown function (DUF4410)